MLKCQHVAQWLGIAAATLGIIAGMLQTTVGAQIPDWSGNKYNPFALGLLTIVLSLVALAGAIVLGRTPISTPRRLLAAVALLITGLLCFTTVGILWYLPGALMLAASVLAFSAGAPQETRRFVAAHWIAGAISVAGLLQLMLALGTGVLWIAAIGVVGSIAVVVAPWRASRLARTLWLVVGTVPFAVLTWWSIVSALVALIAIGLGVTLKDRDRTTIAPEQVEKSDEIRTSVTT